VTHIPSYIDAEKFESFKKISQKETGKVLARWLLILLAWAIIVLLLPWTQNIQSRGKVTALNPGDRPQTIHSTIPGRIEKWFVNEGQFVNKGDTIVFISETKAEFFDPELLARTQSQIDAKQSSVKSYEEKVIALDKQINALRENLELKLKQAENKIKQAHLKVSSDSIEFKAAKTNYDIADKQFKRQQELYEQGLVSLTNLELRELKFQESMAKLISAENSLISSQNELLNAKIEYNSIKSDYADKIAKSQSERAGAFSNQYDADAEVVKLKNQLSNYAIRSGFRYITAPQDCYINKALITGVGETMKEGDAIVSITPAIHNLAVELFVQPVDLPLIRTGEKVRIIFDGWPAFVFSGWPNVSFGTFGGTIVAIEQNISTNGQFRIPVSPDVREEKWPALIRMGGGAFGMALLNDVPVWYELWRQLNGFPPDFYEPANEKKPKK
jgi:membrane fusion protein, adhesin transport system